MHKMERMKKKKNENELVEKHSRIVHLEVLFVPLCNYARRENKIGFYCYPGKMCNRHCWPKNFHHFIRRSYNQNRKNHTHFFSIFVFALFFKFKQQQQRIANFFLVLRFRSIFFSFAFHKFFYFEKYTHKTFYFDLKFSLEMVCLR